MLADSDSLSGSNGASSNTASNGTQVEQQHASEGSSTNGTHKAVPTSSTLNGAANRDEGPPRQPHASYAGHDREEVTRLLLQALSDMGYHDAADSVSKESGYALESPTVAAFRQAVLNGDWTDAERLLMEAVPASESHQNDTDADSALVLAPTADKNQMRFWVRQQKFLELLEQKDTSRALTVLRNELSPLNHDTQKLHILSSLLMCNSVDDLKTKAGWDGASGESRQLLLSELSQNISPRVMLPEHRLAVLMQRLRAYEAGSCFYHTSAELPSLYSDHYCHKDNFPTEVLHELDLKVGGHAGEVWQIKFSNDGTRLASCGQDKHVIIWDTTTFEPEFRLDAHEGGCGNITWSPDDKYLVTCGRDKTARIWDTTSGLLLQPLTKFKEPVSSCVWAPDGQSIILGSFDKENGLCTWSTNGTKLFTWTKQHRTEDVALSPDGHWLVAMDERSRIHVYNFGTRELHYEMSLLSRPLSITISQDSNFLLVGSQDGEINLFDLITREKIRKYLGAKGGDFLIRSTLGGANENFVISGSEDGKLVLWHKNIGTMMFKLNGHKPRSNSVAWSPTDPCLFASCGDDRVIKIWSNEERLRQRDQASHSNGNDSSNGWQPRLPDVAP